MIAITKFGVKHFPKVAGSLAISENCHCVASRSTVTLTTVNSGSVYFIKSVIHFYKSKNNFFICCNSDKQMLI